MTLHEYVKWVIRQGWDALALPSIEQRTGPGWCLDVVHRERNFQVERVAVPNGTIVLHRHPGVETCEYFVRGSGVLQIDHRFFELADDIPSSRQIVPIPSFAWHGGKIGPDGIVFLSIQEWKEGITLSSVSEVWEGPVPKVI